ncbi:MAG: BACON domain-containing protein [Alistipes sp.]|nr:BACON domain-containing protein [Alistipes sp.]
MKRFLLIIAIAAVCAGCQFLDVEPAPSVDSFAKAELRVDKSEFTLDYTAHSVEVEVYANLPYDVVVDVDWVGYAVSDECDRVLFHISENGGSEPRTTEVVIAADELQHTITIYQACKPERMQLRLEHTSTTLDTPIWEGKDIKGVVDWGDGTTEEYSAGMSHDYADTQKHSAQFAMEGATSFYIERIGEIESVTIIN